MDSARRWLTPPINNTWDTITEEDITTEIDEINDEIENDSLYLVQNPDERKKLEQLRNLMKQCQEYTGQDFTLIRDSYFPEYAREYAEDETDTDLDEWPYSCIDWDAAAVDLQSAFTGIEFDGVTYWVKV